MKRLKTELNALVNRGVDRHLRLAVTGLSRSGKTAFITAMVNQLLNVHAARAYRCSARYAKNACLA
ncbi:YcjX [Salmonella enterica subsp. enterica serovar Newport str. 36807]|nr:YcjX [Salmonella enterica subsp. enterica serovar Newport str. 36807]